MQMNTEFSGLPMPVFTAFGWAGEDTALKFALAELEEFIKTLHANLPRLVQDRFPVCGLNSGSNNVYLAPTANPEEDIHIAFNARPMSLEIELAIVDKGALGKVLRNASNDLVNSYNLLSALGSDWNLRVQQMEVDEETGESAFSKDLFKDELSNLDEKSADALISTAAYLNGESQWVTPISIRRRIPSEQAAAMGMAIIDEMRDEVAKLMPLIDFFSGQTKANRAPKPKPKQEETSLPEPEPIDLSALDAKDGFSYVAELKPLHIRRGFINLTSGHWPFFADSARATTKEVTVYYEGSSDKESTVWRLVPGGQARIVLGPSAHRWLETSFDSDDRIEVIARKMDDDEIQLSLKTAG